MGHSKGNPEREVYSYTGLPKMSRNISNKQINPTLDRNSRNKNKDNPEQVQGRK